jgi:hypothetical protein
VTEFVSTPQAPPLVSVVTPCYNSAPFVAETVEAVLAQRYPQVEHIVVDDGSTDESWAVLEHYAGRITAVRVPKNRGGSHARNLGASMARGSFLMFLDADDLISPDTLDALVAAAGACPQAIAFSRWRRLRCAGGEWRLAPAEVPLPAPQADHLRSWLDGVWVPPAAVLWRREVYESTGGWDEALTFNDDGDLMMRALAGGARLVPAGGGEAYYRVHEPARVSVSASMASPERFRSAVRVLEKLAQLLEGQGRLTEYADPLGLAYHRLALNGFQFGLTEQARQCERMGERYAGRREVSPTWVGRFVSRLVGLERKERIAEGLASYGILTPKRRKFAELRNLRRRGTSRKDES